MVPVGKSSFVGAGGTTNVTVRSGGWHVTPPKRGERPALLRLWLEFPFGASRGDVTLPAERVYFSAPVWQARRQRRQERLRFRGVLRVVGDWCRGLGRSRVCCRGARRVDRGALEGSIVSRIGHRTRDPLKRVRNETRTNRSCRRGQAVELAEGRRALESARERLVATAPAEPFARLLEPTQDLRQREARSPLSHTNTSRVSTRATRALVRRRAWRKPSSTAPRRRPFYL